MFFFLINTILNAKMLRNVKLKLSKTVRCEVTVKNANLKLNTTVT